MRAPNEFRACAKLILNRERCSGEEIKKLFKNISSKKNLFIIHKGVLCLKR